MEGLTEFVSKSFEETGGHVTHPTSQDGVGTNTTPKTLHSARSTPDDVITSARRERSPDVEVPTDLSMVKVDVCSSQPASPTDEGTALILFNI